MLLSRAGRGSSVEATAAVGRDYAERSRAAHRAGRAPACRPSSATSRRQDAAEQVASRRSREALARPVTCTTLIALTFSASTPTAWSWPVKWSPHVSPGARAGPDRRPASYSPRTAISTGLGLPTGGGAGLVSAAEHRRTITQLLGRMIRTPLARRIPGNELLNSVECFLPRFDRKTATSVAEMLMRGSTSKGDAEAETGSGGGAGRRVLLDPFKLHRNPDVPMAVWKSLRRFLRSVFRSAT